MGRGANMVVMVTGETVCVHGSDATDIVRATDAEQDRHAFSSVSLFGVSL